MSFDWTEYLKLARELARPTTRASNDEARLRSAISRAYYAAFLMARNHLREKESHQIPPDGQAHFYVQEQFRNSPNKGRKEVGRTLRRLRRFRNQADYADRFPRLQTTAALALQLATQIIARLGRL